ncbi:MAG: hypothetical protein IJF72_00120 [Clostridia bacterium]|nr:hypothetical protein [Clostridia bacterium]
MSHIVLKAEDLTKRRPSMNLTQELLYLLLLYAVLDKDRKLSLTTGLIIAFAIILLSNYRQNCCNTQPRCGCNNGCCNNFQALNFL